MVTIDGNHPLAGATLNFDVKVLGVREATAKDMHGGGHGDHERDAHRQAESGEQRLPMAAAQRAR